MTLANFARTTALCLTALMMLDPIGCHSADGEGESQASAASLSGAPKFNVRFQTREPRECAAVKSAPSPEQAAALVQCGTEGTSSQFATLYQDVKVEMGSSRPFLMGSDGYMNDIDPSAKVYPIRGGGTLYICSQVDDVMKNKGKNCSVTPTTKMEGSCYKTKFGDWKCNLGGGQGTQSDGKPGPTAY